MWTFLRKIPFSSTWKSLQSATKSNRIIDHVASNCWTHLHQLWSIWIHSMLRLAENKDDGWTHHLHVYLVKTILLMNSIPRCSTRSLSFSPPNYIALMWMKEITFWIYYWTSLGNVLKWRRGNDQCWWLIYIYLGIVQMLLLQSYSRTLSHKNHLLHYHQVGILFSPPFLCTFNGWHIYVKGVVYNAYSYLFSSRSGSASDVDPMPMNERSLLLLLLLTTQLKTSRDDSTAPVSPYRTVFANLRDHNG